MPYLVVSEASAAALTERVNALEAQGWKATGGVSVAMIARPTWSGKDRADLVFAQALTKGE